VRPRFDIAWVFAAIVLLTALSLAGYVGWPYVERAFGWNQPQSLCGYCTF